MEGGCWHTHDDFLVRATSDEYFDVCYVDIITGLAERRVLLCERWESGQVTNREFVADSGYVYDLSDFRDGEEIRVRPAALIPST
jgi:hypothetical protein